MVAWWLAGCGVQELATAVVDPPAVECATEGAECLRFGVTGTCLHERCVLPSGHCSYDIDCDDGNACSRTWCDLGTCRVEDVAGGCALDNDAPGVCRAGVCAAAAPGSCATDSDCPDLDGLCERLQCEAGACVSHPADEGAACRVASGRSGTCAAGECAADLTGEAENAPSCGVKYNAYWDVYYRDCKSGLRFRLTDEDLQEATKRIEERLAESLQYELSASLVPLADGGYNIVLHNRRDRSEVAGLVDPSFVAFTMASYTAGTTWRSRQLQVWVTPYGEGWAIPTSGSRFALQRGRENSGLGWLGVVDVPAFRKWLRKAFAPLPPAPPDPEVVGAPK